MIKILLILLFLAEPCFAVTRFVVTVNKSGEDYDTITLAENALDNSSTGTVPQNMIDGTLKVISWGTCSGTCTSASFIDGEAVTWDTAASTGVMVHLTATQALIDITAGTLDVGDIVDDGDANTITVTAVDSAIISIQPYNDENSGILPDTTITLSGFTTNASNYVEISVPDGERHGGLEGVGARINGGATVNILTLSPGVNQCRYCIVEFLEIYGAGNGSTAGYAIGTLSAGGFHKIRNNLIHDVGSGTGSSAGVVLCRSGVVTNNIIYDTRGQGIVEFCGSGLGGIDITNNTIYNFNTRNIAGAEGIDILGNSGVNNVRNNLVFRVTTSSADYLFGSGITGTNNGSSDTSGSVGWQSLIVDDELETVSSTSTADFHLEPTSSVINDGVTVASAAVDIDGTTRTGAYDLGADEFVSAGGGGSRRPMLSN